MIDPDLPLRQQFPAYCSVWHKANHKRHIVIGWADFADGTERLIVSDDSGSWHADPNLWLKTDPEKEFVA